LARISLAMPRCFIVLAALALAGCGASSPQCSSVDAQGLVKGLQPKEQFRAMLKMIAERTQTVAMAEQRDGSRIKQKLSEAVDAAVERHGAEWERNLISSWSTLSSAELKQVCKALDERDQSTFMRFTQRISAEVQSRNEPLLNRAGAEVLKAVWLQD
jgi:hypothetical protein